MRPLLINVVPTTRNERRAWERAGVFVREPRLPPAPLPAGALRHFWPGVEYKHELRKMACGARVRKVGGARYTALRHDGDHPVTCRRCRASAVFNA